MESDTCGPCQYRGVASRSVKYCKTCQEELCKDCADVHKSSRATRSHFLVGITDISIVSETGFAIENLQNCTDHPNKHLEFFCRTHNHLICSTCVLLDKKTNCTNVIEVAKAGKALVQNNFDAKLKADLVSMSLKLKRDVDAIANQKTLTGKKQTDIKEWLIEVRAKVISLFDKLENDILSEVKVEVMNENENLGVLLDRINENLNKINDVSLVFDSVIQNGSESDIFRGILLVGYYLGECQTQIDLNKSSIEIRHHSFNLSNALHLLLTENIPMIERCESRDQFFISRCPKLQSSFDEFLEISDNRNKRTSKSSHIPDSNVKIALCGDCVEKNSNYCQSGFEIEQRQKNTSTTCTTTTCDQQYTADVLLSETEIPVTSIAQTTMPPLAHPIRLHLPQCFFNFPPPAHNVFHLLANDMPLCPSPAPTFITQFSPRTAPTSRLENYMGGILVAGGPEMQIDKPVAGKTQSQLNISSVICEQISFLQDEGEIEQPVENGPAMCGFDQKNKVQSLEPNANKIEVEMQLKKQNKLSRRQNKNKKTKRLAETYLVKPETDIGNHAHQIEELWNNKLSNRQSTLNGTIQRLDEANTESSTEFAEVSAIVENKENRPSAFKLYEHSEDNNMSQLKRKSFDTEYSDLETKYEMNSEEKEIQKSYITGFEDHDSVKHTQNNERCGIMLKTPFSSEIVEHIQSVSNKTSAGITLHESHLSDVELMKETTSETERNSSDFKYFVCNEEQAKVHELVARAPKEEIAQTEINENATNIQECCELEKEQIKEEITDFSESAERNEVFNQTLTETLRNVQCSNLDGCVECTPVQFQEELTSLHKPRERNERKEFDIKPQSVVAVPWEGKLRSEFMTVLTLPNESIIACDFISNRFISFDKEFQLQDKFKLPAKFEYVGHMKRHQLAVCHKNRARITVLDSSPNFKVVGCFDTQYLAKCVVAVDDNSMLVSMIDWVGKWHLHIISNKGKLISKLKMKRTLLDGYRYAIMSSVDWKFGYRILQCCEESDALYCFESDGTEIFKFRVKSPNCIAVHKTGHIFLIDNFEQIHVLSSSGQQLYKTKCSSDVISVAVTPKMNALYLTSYKDRNITVLSVSSGIKPDVNGTVF